MLLVYMNGWAFDVTQQRPAIVAMVTWTNVGSGRHEKWTLWWCVCSALVLLLVLMLSLILLTAVTRHYWSASASRQQQDEAGEANMAFCCRLHSIVHILTLSASSSCSPSSLVPAKSCTGLNITSTTHHINNAASCTPLFMFHTPVISLLHAQH